MGKKIVYAQAHIRSALYRPFTKQSLYFSDTIIDERGSWPRFSPTEETKNRVIMVFDSGHRTPFSVMMTDCIPDLHLCSAADGFQCFLLYTYSLDGSTRFRQHHELRVGKSAQIVWRISFA
jgi:predicted helicase